MSLCIPPVHPRRVQSESNLTEVIRRNRSKNKCRHVRVRCPSIPRLVRHEFLMAVMPHDRQPHVAVATTPKEVASSGFVHEKGFHQPRHGGSPPNLPRDTMPSPTWRPSPRSVQHGAHGLWPAHNRVRPSPIRVRAKPSMERRTSRPATTVRPESIRVRSRRRAVKCPARIAASVRAQSDRIG